MYKEYYESNKSEIIKQLHEVGYTPRTLAEEANKENLSIYEYIYLILN